jgi:DNA-binding transcriptional regulator GbsR (MarR family)
MTKDLERLRNEFIEAAGHVTQSFGFGRILGQIYAWIYFNPGPQSLDDLTTNLGVSKGSASMSVRQLEQWTALRKVWVKGDRKDYYEANDDFGRVIRRMAIDLIGQKMETADHLLQDAESLFKGTGSNGNRAQADHFRKQVAKLRQFRQKTQGLLDSPLVRILMKKK